MTERGARLDGERRLLQVSDVLRAIEDQFHTAFPRRVWVCGLVRSLHTGPVDHELGSGQPVDSFVLVEDTDDGLRTLPCELAAETRDAIDDTMGRLHDVSVDDLLVDGHYIRAGGLLSYDPRRHCAIFTVTALDPLPTAEWLAERRDLVRAAAAAARLSERQRDLRVPMAPSSIALVAPAGDPALERAQETLSNCGFEVEMRVYAPDTAGSAAGDQLANGLREAALAGHDLVLLLRQDGRPLSLAPYDSEAVVRAIATSPTPILTGLGSRDEPAAAEEVSHQAYASAAEATESVIRRLQRAADLVDDTLAAVADAGDEALRRAARRLEQVRHGIAELSRQATVRTQQLRAKRLMRIRLAAGVLALLIVAGVAAVQLWPLLALLVIPLAIVLTASRLHPQRRGPVTVTDMTFSEALAQLSTIGRQLQEAADPDDVTRLEAEAEALAEHCRLMLRRPRPLRQFLSEPAPVYPTVAADGGVVGAAVAPGSSAVSEAPASINVDADEIVAAGDYENPTEASATLVLPSDPVHLDPR